MPNLADIQAKVASGQYEFSQHALDQTVLRHISVQEIRESVADSEVIEDYPNDKYGPSCLLLGHTQTRRPLHVQCSYPSRPLVKIITAYEPNLAQWINLRTRTNTNGSH